MNITDRWMWALRYGVVIVVALILAAALGEMDLFKTTRFGKTGLNASRVVQFLGYGGALAVFWLLAQRAAAQISGNADFWRLVRSILLPLATLIVVACAHSVVLLLLGPLMSKASLPAYNWVFIAGIILSAAWLVVALFTGSASLGAAFSANRKG